MKQPFNYLSTEVEFHNKQLDAVKDAMKKFAIDFAEDFVMKNDLLYDTDEVREYIKKHYDENIRQ